MSSTWRLRCVAALLVVGLTASVRAQSFGFPWWRDPQFQKDLALTADQSARIDAVFQKTVPGLREKKTQLDAEEDQLSRMIAASAEESAVTRQVDKVEAIRSYMNKTRTLMLLHMRQVLTPEQRVKLSQLHEKWEKEHRRERGK